MLSGEGDRGHGGGECRLRGGGLRLLRYAFCNSGTLCTLQEQGLDKRSAGSACSTSHFGPDAGVASRLMYRLTPFRRPCANSVQAAPQLISQTQEAETISIGPPVKYVVLLRNFVSRSRLTGICSGFCACGIARAILIAVT